MAKPRDLTVPALPRPDPFCCPGARRFAAFVTTLLADVRQGASDPGVINRGKLFLLDRFMAERASAPAGHRDRAAGENGTACLYGVFLAGYVELRDLELAADPPPLSRPPPPPELSYEELRDRWRAAQAARKRDQARQEAKEPPLFLGEARRDG